MLQKSRRFRLNSLQVVAVINANDIAEVFALSVGLELLSREIFKNLKKKKKKKKILTQIRRRAVFSR